MPTPDVPDGFAPIETSAFVDLLGPLHFNPETGGYGLRVRPEHANTHGNGHGGFLATMLDVACSRGTRSALADGSAVSTVSMTLNYLEPAPVGGWLDLTSTVDRAGGRTVFTSGVAAVGGLVVAKAAIILARHRPRA